MNILVKCILIVLLSTQYALAAEQIYVSSKTGSLYQQDTFTSEKISTLKKGDEMQAIKYKGNWVKVKYSALQGWVPRYTVSKTKPSAEKISFFNRLKSFFTSSNSRARISNVSTAGGIRGLAEGEAENSGNKDYQSVEKMEQLEVTDEEVEKFIEGNNH